MDIRHLRYFTEVIRHDGFARAADSAHVTQPTLSKAVARLEAEAGTRLLERTRNGVHLTQAGAIVHRHALAMLARSRQLHTDLDALHNLDRGELRLGLPPIGSGVLFAPLLARYHERHPNIDIHLMELGSRQLEAAVLSGELDVAGSLLPVGEGLTWQPVCDEPMMALLPHGHPHANARRFRLEWLHEAPLILFEQGFALNKLIRDICREHGITPRETVHSGQVDFILALVTAGTGIALLPRVILKDHNLAGGVAIPLDSRELRWQLVLTWRRDTRPAPAVRAWLDLVDDADITA